MILNYQFTNSTMLSSASYDTEAKELTVMFTNGKSYIYEDVDTNTYNALIGAKSVGGYFNSIKSQLKVKK